MKHHLVATEFDSSFTSIIVVELFCREIVRDPNSNSWFEDNYFGIGIIILEIQACPHFLR